MSKILEAMRRTTSDGSDYAFRLATVGGPSLYPPPPRAQLREFEQLANTLIHHQDGTTGKVVVFCSTVGGEGSSYVSYNVARHLSLVLDRKVAWVDANFCKPQTKLPQTGITFRSLLQSPELFSELRTASNLVVIPNGNTPIKSTDLINSDSYTTLLEHFQRGFYFTILDAPPILESIDVAHLAEPTLGLVLVIESRRLKHEVIKHGLDVMTAANVNVLGTVLNRRTFHIPGFLYRRL